MRERADRGPEVKTLGGAARDFAKRHSPWMILAAIAVLAAVRALAGGPLTWRDAVAVAAMGMVYPFGEWAIHVYLLHAKPVAVRGRRIELPTTREHAFHHRDPSDLAQLLLAAKQLGQLLLVAVPVVVLAIGVPVGLLAGGVPVGALITAGLTAYVLVGTYEWTHFLIHTAYRPQSRAYRRIWLNHRLHHFKNERYWHGITNTIADRALGSYPDHRGVPRSATARTLAR